MKSFKWKTINIEMTCDIIEMVCSQRCEKEESKLFIKKLENFQEEFSQLKKKGKYIIEVK